MLTPLIGFLNPQPKNRVFIYPIGKGYSAMWVYPNGSLKVSAFMLRGIGTLAFNLG